MHFCCLKPSCRSNFSRECMHAALAQPRTSSILSHPAGGLLFLSRLRSAMAGWTEENTLSTPEQRNALHCHAQSWDFSPWHRHVGHQFRHPGCPGAGPGCRATGARGRWLRAMGTNGRSRASTPNNKNVPTLLCSVAAPAVVPRVVRCWRGSHKFWSAMLEWARTGGGEGEGRAWEACAAGGSGLAADEQNKGRAQGHRVKR